MKFDVEASRFCLKQSPLHTCMSTEFCNLLLSVDGHLKTRHNCRTLRQTWHVVKQSCSQGSSISFLLIIPGMSRYQTGYTSIFIVAVHRQLRTQLTVWRWNSEFPRQVAIQLVRICESCRTLGRKSAPQEIQTLIQRSWVEIRHFESKDLKVRFATWVLYSQISCSLYFFQEVFNFALFKQIFKFPTYFQWTYLHLISAELRDKLACCPKILIGGNTRRLQWVAGKKQLEIWRMQG